MKNPEEWQLRVLNERATVAENLKVLDGAICTPYYGTLDEETQNDLQLQKAIMWDYLQILDKRIKRF